MIKACELKRNDIIGYQLNRTRNKATVIKSEHLKDRVILFLIGAGNTKMTGMRRVVFRVDAQFEYHGKDATIRKAYDKVLLSVARFTYSGMPAISRNELIRKVASDTGLSQPSVSDQIRIIAKTDLVKLMHSDQRTFDLRPKLKNGEFIHVPAILFPGRATEVLGWIESWKEIGDFYRPIFRDVEGRQTVALDQWIDFIPKSSLTYDQVQNMMNPQRVKLQLATYLTPDDFIGMFTSKGISNLWIKKIAGIIGIAINQDTRNHVLTYLDANYPGWKQKQAS